MDRQGAELPGRLPKARTERLDVMLVRLGLAETRERAQSLISSGFVNVNGLPGTRASLAVTEGSEIEVRQDPTSRFVSRGALKLLAALDLWRIDVSGAVAIDFGASTGGFTDLLLERGATRVFAVDVGYGQLHFRLRNDPRVVLMERTNIRNVTSLPDSPAIATCDVSFISLRLALPPVFSLLQTNAPIVALIKPQFEAGRGQVGKGGVVRNSAVHRQVLESLVAWSDTQPYRVVRLTVSPIKGPAGNIEFLSLWNPTDVLANATEIDSALEAARALV